VHGDWVSAQPPTLGAAPARVAGLPRRLFDARALIASFVHRELHARIAGTLLGRLWPLVHPLALFAVYWFVFTRLFGVRASTTAGGSGALALYMFVGVLVWSSFAEALNRCAQVVVEHGPLLRKVAFPAEILPLNVVLVALVPQLLGALAFVVIRAFNGALDFDHLAWLPLVLVAQVLLSYGLGLIVASAQVFMRDTAHVLALTLTLAMFATPVFWIPDPSALPGIAPWFGWIEANPLHHLLCAWRTTLSADGASAALQSATLASLARVVAWGLAAVVCGQLVFARAQRRFADEV
jgi:ABC-type polysaccharide/polyol phosphate export permease